jgi:3-methyladenine DNA glycosylase/8-oxoguanine DNA glycosylase
MTEGSLERVIELDGPLDLALTLRPLYRGPADPTMRLVGRTAAWATRTRSGPATLELRHLAPGRILAAAWGPGAEAALDGAPRLLGLGDDGDGFEPRLHPTIAELAKRMRGLRLLRTEAVFEALLPAVLEQKVTGAEAFRSYRGLIRRFGEAAPGPHGLRGMRLQPAPETLAKLPYYVLHPFGVEARRADVIRRLARDATRLEELLAGAPEAASARLQGYPGVGPWTAAEVTLRAFGDADAVSIGDFHLPHLVAYVLAGEPRGTDERMLELLEPWRGHRARVIRLLEASGLGPPRRGPRMPAREIAAI